MAIARNVHLTMNLLMIVTRMMIEVELVTVMNLIQMQIRDCKTEREAKASFFDFYQFISFQIQQAHTA